MGRKATIRVKHSAEVRLRGELLPAGWYVWVRGSLDWEAVERLRFHRRCDAQRAMSALVAQGITSKRAMHRAGAERVLSIAFEALQW